MMQIEPVKTWIHSLIVAMNWNLDDNFKDTPARVAKWLDGYQSLSKDECLTKSMKDLYARFPTKNNQLIIVGPTKTFSLCPHHLQVIEYNTFIGYIPCEEAVGLSKLSRVPQNFSRYPYIQEEFTDEIAKCINRVLKPKGVMVIVKGIHNCMRVRGVKQPDAYTITSAIRGVFEDPPPGKDPRGEMLRLISLG